ncbi:DinB family protein [Geofilum sp. OHC36d9]|uniref:DinB family protein n=1 Tax=Geofilum sp. OHC36d9 TaxID=3458413 RepID=UPI0040342850
MIETAKHNLNQLRILLEKLNSDDYSARPEVLSGASIGEHYRHILEFYLLLVSGSFTGVISYDRRERDGRIAQNTHFAIETINRIIAGINTLDLNSRILMEVEASTDEIMDNRIFTSVGRELAYCIEHSIHHQAIIKIGLIATGRIQLVDEQFGVAYSTIRYRNNSCAQ